MSSYLSILEGIGSISDKQNDSNDNNTSNNTIDNRDSNDNINVNNIRNNDHEGGDVEDLGLGYFGVYCLSDISDKVDNNNTKIDTNIAANIDPITEPINKNHTFDVPNIDIWPSDNNDGNGIFEFYTEHEASIGTDDDFNTMKIKNEIMLICEKLNLKKEDANIRNGTVIDKISSKSIFFADTFFMIFTPPLSVLLLNPFEQEIII
jgi:hypothetical protein